MDFVEIAGKRFPTLVAITPEEQATGLMWKKWPPPNMVFPYRSASIRKFWMKNCVSPLDILFCNNGKIVSICYGEPLSTQLIGPDFPSDLVIELPHGTVDSYGIKVHDKVNMLFSKESASKGLLDSLQTLLSDRLAR